MVWAVWRDRGSPTFTNLPDAPPPRLRTKVGGRLRIGDGLGNRAGRDGEGLHGPILAGEVDHAVDEGGLVDIRRVLVQPGDEVAVLVGQDLAAGEGTRSRLGRATPVTASVPLSWRSTWPSLRLRK